MARVGRLVRVVVVVSIERAVRVLRGAPELIGQRAPILLRKLPKGVLVGLGGEVGRRVAHHLAVAARRLFVGDTVWIAVVALQEVAVLLLALWVGAEKLLKQIDRHGSS